METRSECISNMTPQLFGKAYPLHYICFIPSQPQLQPTPSSLIPKRNTSRMKPLLSIPLTILLVYRAWSRKSLTTLGLLAAAITAIVHAIHPWSLPFTLLCVFYLAGTKVTKVCLSFLLTEQLGIQKRIEAKLTRMECR